MPHVSAPARSSHASFPLFAPSPACSSHTICGIFGTSRPREARTLAVHMRHPQGAGAKRHQLGTGKHALQQPPGAHFADLPTSRARPGENGNRRGTDRVRIGYSFAPSWCLNFRPLRPPGKPTLCAPAWPPEQGHQNHTKTTPGNAPPAPARPPNGDIEPSPKRAQSEPGFFDSRRPAPPALQPPPLRRVGRPLPAANALSATRNARRPTAARIARLRPAVA
jgi:hypothetical protein